jgi:hypothetical protein
MRGGIVLGIGLHFHQPGQPAVAVSQQLAQQLRRHLCGRAKKARGSAVAASMSGGGVRMWSSIGDRPAKGNGGQREMGVRVDFSSNKPDAFERPRRKTPL